MDLAVLFKFSLFLKNNYTEGDSVSSKKKRYKETLIEFKKNLDIVKINKTIVKLYNLPEKVHKNREALYHEKS